MRFAPNKLWRLFVDFYQIFWRIFITNQHGSCQKFVTRFLTNFWQRFGDFHANDGLNKKPDFIDMKGENSTFAILVMSLFVGEWFAIDYSNMESTWWDFSSCFCGIFAAAHPVMNFFHHSMREFPISRNAYIFRQKDHLPRFWVLFFWHLTLKLTLTGFIATKHWGITCGWFDLNCLPTTNNHFPEKRWENPLGNGNETVKPPSERGSVDHPWLLYRGWIPSQLCRCYIGIITSYQKDAS